VIERAVTCIDGSWIVRTPGDGKAYDLDERVKLRMKKPSQSRDYVDYVGAMRP